MYMEKYSCDAVYRFFRALAKRTAKETSKEVVKEAERKYVTNGKQQEH